MKEEPITTPPIRDGIIINGKAYQIQICKNKQCAFDCHLIDECAKRKRKGKPKYCAGFHEATVFKLHWRTNEFLSKDWEKWNKKFEK